MKTVKSKIRNISPRTSMVAWEEDLSNTRKLSENFNKLGMGTSIDSTGKLCDFGCEEILE